MNHLDRDQCIHNFVREQVLLRPPPHLLDRSVSERRQHNYQTSPHLKPLYQCNSRYGLSKDNIAPSVRLNMPHHNSQSGNPILPVPKYIAASGKQHQEQQKQQKQEQLMEPHIYTSAAPHPSNKVPTFGRHKSVGYPHGYTCMRNHLRDHDSYPHMVQRLPSPV